MTKHLSLGRMLGKVYLATAHVKKKYTSLRGGDLAGNSYIEDLKEEVKDIRKNTRSSRMTRRSRSGSSRHI